MKKMKKMTWPLALAGVISLGTLTSGSLFDGVSLISPSNAEDQAVSPVKARERDAYYPNSEDLKPDEFFWGRHNKP